MIRTLSLTALITAFSMPVFARPHGPGPCMRVKAACQSAGFVQGQWKAGFGLWLDCINPIMQGVTTVPGATKSLPQVDVGTIAACKTIHPKFGSGKVGSAPAAKKM